MTTASRANEGLLGIAIQSAEGSAAGTATYNHTLYSGLPRPVRADAEMEVASTSMYVPGMFTSRQHWEANPTFPVLPQSIGTWLRAMFGTVSSTGSGTVTHTFTPATSPPFVTLWGQNPGTAYRKFADGTVNELAISFEAGQPLRAQANVQGYTPSDLAAAWSVTTSEAFDTDGQFFTYIGATMKLDDDATPAATTVGTIRSGVLTISRVPFELIQTDGLEPEHRSLGLFKAAFSLQMLFANYETFKATYFGSVAGTTSSAVLTEGAIDFLFGVAPTAAPTNRSLELVVPTARIAVPDPPDVDTGAGPVMLNVVGTTWKGSSDLITGTLVNAVTSY